MPTIDAAALLIGLREGLEALLILGMLLAILRRLGQSGKARHVWLGAALGVVASVAVGLVVQAIFATWFEDGPGAAIFEVVVALVAVGILSYMVLWMQSHTMTLAATVKARTEEAARQGRWALLGGLAFFTVFREGLETVLFYAARLTEVSWGTLILSGLIGFALSALLAYGMFRLTTRISLRAFFAVTGTLLIFVAAGLLVHVVHAASDLGWLPHGEPLWDTSGALPDDGHWLGGPLHAIIGYEDQPTALQLLLYLGYILGVGGWYATRLAKPGRTRRTGAIAGSAFVVLLLGFAVAGAVPSHGPAGHHDGRPEASVPHETLIADAIAALEGYDGKVGILVRHHGEPIHYNATTYASFKAFVDSIWPYTGLPAELLQVDQGTILIDGARPFASQPAADSRLVDAWLKPYAGVALPYADPAGLATVEEDLAGGAFYIAPGLGPGVGEGDVYEMLGLGSYRTWLKMENSSPMYAAVQEAWGILDDHVRKHFGDKAVVAFAHHIDPKVDPGETPEAAARRLVDAGATVVIDAYMSSAHSDAMDTCMMAPHTLHALHDAGFTGKVVRAGMPGTHEAWARAAADEVERLLQDYPAGEPVAVHLAQHGGDPASKNPCGDGPDQYRANVLAEYALAEAAILQRMGDRPVTVRQVYGQGADAADDGVLAPMEALALDRDAGIRHAVVLPYEFWGNAMDNLVPLREALGFQPEDAPYYGPGHTTRLTLSGVDVLVASAHYGTPAKAEAMLARIGEAIVVATEA